MELWDSNSCGCGILCLCAYCGDVAHACSDTRLATTYTDAYGYFTFTVNNDPSYHYYLRFILIGKDGSFTILHVEKYHLNPGFKEEDAYWGVVDIGSLPDGYSGPGAGDGHWLFEDSRYSNIYYHIVKAYDWMKSNAAFWSMYKVSVTFGPGYSGPTCMVPRFPYIWINQYHGMDGDGPTHEYGHHIMYHFYGDRMPHPPPYATCSVAPDGCEYGHINPWCYCKGHEGAKNSCTCDAIMEGWADFFGCLIPEEANRDWVTDSYFTMGHHDGTGANVRFRPAEWNNIVDPKDELTFQRILWDLIDGTNGDETVGGKGAIQVDFDVIWEVMSGHSTSFDNAWLADPVTLKQYWDFSTSDYRSGELKSYFCRAFALHGVTTYCNGNYCGCGCVYDSRQCGQSACNDCNGSGCTESLCAGNGCYGVTNCECYGYHCSTSVCTGTYCEKTNPQPCGGRRSFPCYCCKNCHG